MRLIVSILLAVVFVSCETYKEDKELVFVNWPVENSIIFNVDFKDSEWSTDSIYKKRRILYKVEMKVFKENNTTMVRWRVLENENPVIQKVPSLSDLGNSGTYKKSSLEIIYSLDELGRFNEIENWQEVEKFWDLKLHEQVNTKGVNNAKSDSVFDVIKSAFGTKPMIESSVTKDIMALHIYNGISYKPELQVDTVILVGLENSPMPSIVTTQIFEESDSYFALQTTQKMFPENLANQMDSFLGKFTNDGENEIPEVFMTDTCYSNFFANDSIPYAVNYWRTVKLGDRNKLVQITLTREFGLFN